MADADARKVSDDEAVRRDRMIGVVVGLILLTLALCVVWWSGLAWWISGATLQVIGVAFVIYDFAKIRREGASATKMGRKALFGPAIDRKDAPPAESPDSDLGIPQRLEAVEKSIREHEAAIANLRFDLTQRLYGVSSAVARQARADLDALHDRIMPLLGALREPRWSLGGSALIIAGIVVSTAGNVVG